MNRLPFWTSTLVASAMTVCGAIAHATVTYDGSAGVYSNIFNANSQERCIDCHNGTGAGGAPVEVRFDSYGWALSRPSYYVTAADCDGVDVNNCRNDRRAKVRAVDWASMPPTGTPLNAGEQALLTAWISDGSLMNAAPSVTASSATSITETSATLNASVNENGADASFVFHYGLTSSSLTSSSSTIMPSGTGGGVSSTAVSAAITGLTCGTKYYFNITGVNSVSTSSSSVLSFTSSSCDADKDGIPNSVEIAAGLNPNSAADGRADLDGDGYINVAEYRAGSNINDAGSMPSASFKVKNDFNRDYSADVLWKNTATADVVLWQTKANGSLLSQDTVANEPDANWKMIGVTDVNNDAKGDIIWRNISTGANRIWRMSGKVISANTAIDSDTNLAWEMVGVGDFDGDGKGDILWRNSATGQNRIWFMNGTVVSAKTATTTLANLSNVVVGVGDANNDGKADIVFYNTATGAATLWLMNGATRTASVGLGAIADLNWSIAGLGDVNNDGMIDIIWHDAVTGANKIWKLNGSGAATKIVLGAQTDLNMQPVWVGDVDGDHMADILWRSTATNLTQIWMLKDNAVRQKSNPGDASNLDAVK